MDRRPHIAIVHQDPIPVEVFDHFRRAVEADGLDLHMESVPQPGPFAGNEWLMPTAVMLYITQGYFNGFLGELGKDHYQALKAGIKDLSARFQKVKVTLIGTKGKVSPVQPYSLVFSLCLAVDDGPLFKFLIPVDVPESEVDAAIDAFLDFAEACVDGALPADELAEFVKTPRFGRTVLLVFNPGTGRIEVLDPMPTHLGEACAPCLGQHQI